MRTHGIETLRELTDRSVADVEWFWEAVVRDLDIEFSTPYERVVDLSRGPEWATWFLGGRTNVARQCVDRWAERDPDSVAVIWEGEDGDVRESTYQELRLMTDTLATTLCELGVTAGDTVALFLPMAIETVAALMACSKIGATWVPIFSGFGADAVAARIADARCEVVITANATLRKGAVMPMKPVADRGAEIAGGFPMRRRRCPRGATSSGPSPTPVPRRSMPRLSTASIHCSSDTRAARQEGPRARCMCTAASW
jgi:acetyl-CoA synthetase